MMRENEISNIIKFGLAALLLICLLKMPYGYYQLVRFFAFMVFTVFGFLSYRKEKKVALLIYLGLALLFQPFLKVALGRNIWNIVDATVALGLLISIFFQLRFNNNK